MNKLPTILAASLLAACAQQSMDKPAASDPGRQAVSVGPTVTYPKTEKQGVVDTYFGQRVADPYRWLEDDRSEATEQWVKAENRVTFKYLEQIPYRNTLKQRLEALWNYEKVSSPFQEGDYTYFYKNTGLQNHDVVWRQKKSGGDAEVFLDPNTFSADGTTSLANLSFSKDGSLAAYSVSEGGSDWRKIYVIDTNTKQPLQAPLVDVKFSGISWKGSEGFYYSSYDKPAGSELSAKTDQHKLYYHKIGQPQSEDKVIFGATPEQKRRYVFGRVSEDDRYLVISGSVSTSGNDLYIQDLTRANSPLVTILDDFDSDTYVVENLASELFLVTNRGAPNKKVVAVDAGNPGPENWQDVIPETEHVLSVSTGSGYFFAKYIVDALSKIYQYSYAGKQIREIVLPGPGTATAISGKKHDKVLYYTFTNYKTPGTIYTFDPVKGGSAVYRKSGAQFASDQYESKQVFYTSKDGTKVPMILTYKKGIELNAKNPTLLYGYGGFNISLTPYFSIANTLWLEQGGIYAVANLRGGGEYGKKWHRAGTKLNKQNVFDDFIAAGEYLIAQKYTSSRYLAVHGRSNGGLLVGAVMTQRPDLMQVALPGVGVLDMLRYHTFTAGAGWAYDYGTAEESEAMFKYLRAYSPVHNVREGVSYPATLITTADHDDRVVPAHSFKFAAELQSKQSGPAPVLIRIDTNVGHGAGMPVSKRLEQYADIFAFTFYNMGIKALPH